MLVSISFVVTIDTSGSQPRHWILTIRKISKNATEKRQHATANQNKLRCTKHHPHPTHSLSEHRQRHIASIAACRPAFCFISGTRTMGQLFPPLLIFSITVNFSSFVIGSDLRVRTMGITPMHAADRFVWFYFLPHMQRTYFTRSLLFFLYPRYRN